MTALGINALSAPAPGRVKYTVLRPCDPGGSMRGQKNMAKSVNTDRIYYRRLGMYSNVVKLGMGFAVDRVCKYLRVGEICVSSYQDHMHPDRRVSRNCYIGCV